MAHPFAGQSRSTGHSKMKSMGKTGNLVIPMMARVGENQSGGIRESTASMQHKRQAGATGMKRGGRFGRHKSKIKPDIDKALAASADQAPPAPTMAGPPAPGGPVPGMPPGMPMQKRGGKVMKHSDEAEDRKVVKSMVKKSAMKYAKGGRLPMAGKVKSAGAGSGVGRLQMVKSGHMKHGGRHR